MLGEKVIDHHAEFGALGVKCLHSSDPFVKFLIVLKTELADEEAFADSLNFLFVRESHESGVGSIDGWAAGFGNGAEKFFVHFLAGGFEVGFEFHKEVIEFAHRVCRDAVSCP